MLSFKVILAALFLLLVGTIAVLGFLSYQNSRVSAQTAVLVKHSHEVLETTNEISSLCRDIQLESNAFLIGNDSATLKTYLDATQSVFPLITRLEVLTRDNPSQQHKIDTLELLVHDLIMFTDSVWSARNGNKFNEVIRRIYANNRSRNEIRAVIRRIGGEEIRRLADHDEANTRSVMVFNNTFIWLIGCIGVLLPATFFSIRYNFNKRIRTQEELRAANELFVKLFYDSPIGIVITKLKTGEIIDCNKAYATLLNFERSSLIGRTVDELDIFPADSPQRPILEGGGQGPGVRDLELQLKLRDREPVWVSVSAQKIQIKDEDCLLSALLDTTAHKEAEEKIRQALDAEIELNKLKSNFVTLASHEFRTPLTTILSSSFLLDNYITGESKEKVQKHITRIRRAVNLLTSILDDFLSLTRIEEGKIAPKAERMNLKEALEAMCRNLQGMAKPGQRILYTHTGPEEVCSDPVLLGNIVNNLVSNAIKYSGDNDQIQVSTGVNEKIHLSVKDRGMGISRQDQQHLFERFFRASNTGNTQGTGLGLHIMKHYVDMLNGSIEVASEPGKGSEFIVTFDHIAPADGNV